jgi:hypothetical protein
MTAVDEFTGAWDVALAIFGLHLLVLGGLALSSSAWEVATRLPAWTRSRRPRRTPGAGSETGDAGTLQLRLGNRSVR